MKKTTALFLIFFLIGITSCNKSRVCVKKTDTELADLDESQMTYLTYSHNGDNIKVPHYFTPNGDNVNDILFMLYNDTACYEFTTWPISPYDFEITISNKCRGLFYATDACFAWDGSDSGGNLPKRNGKYRFELSVEWADGTKETFEDYIELIQ